MDSNMSSGTGFTTPNELSANTTDFLNDSTSNNINTVMTDDQSIPSYQAGFKSPATTTIPEPIDNTIINDSSIQNNSTADDKQTAVSTSTTIPSVDDTPAHNYTDSADYTVPSETEYYDNNTNKLINTTQAVCRHVCGCYNKHNTDGNKFTEPRVCASRGARHDHETNISLHPSCNTNHTCHYLLLKSKNIDKLQQNNKLYTDTYNDTLVDYTGENYIEPEYNTVIQSPTSTISDMTHSTPNQQHTITPSTMNTLATSSDYSNAMNNTTSSTTTSDAPDQWIGCDLCGRWRRVFPGVDISKYDNEPWQCNLNTWDPEHNTCDADEEPNDDNEHITGVPSNVAAITTTNPLADQTISMTMTQQQLYETQLKYYQSSVSWQCNLQWPNIPSDYTSESLRKRFYSRLWLLLGQPKSSYPHVNVINDPNIYYIDLYQLWRAANIAGSIHSIHIADWRTMWYSVSIAYYRQQRHTVFDRTLENNLIQQCIHIYNNYCLPFQNSVSTLLLRPAPRFDVQENNRLGPGIRIKVLWTNEEDNVLLHAVQKHGDGKWTAIALDPEYEHRLLRHTTPEIRNRYKALVPDENKSSSHHTHNSNVNTHNQSNRAVAVPLIQPSQQSTALPSSMYRPPVQPGTITAESLGIHLPPVSYPIEAVEWNIKTKDKSATVQSSTRSTKRKRRADDSDESSESDFDSDNSFNDIESLKSDNSTDMDDDGINDLQSNPYYQAWFDIRNCEIQLTQNFALPITELKNHLIKQLKIQPLVVYQLIHELEQSIDLDHRRQLINTCIYTYFTDNNDTMQNILDKIQSYTTYIQRKQKLSEFDELLNKQIRTQQQQQNTAATQQHARHDTVLRDLLSTLQSPIPSINNQHDIQSIRQSIDSQFLSCIVTLINIFTASQIDTSQFANSYALLYSAYAIKLNNLYQSNKSSYVNDELIQSYTPIPSNISELNDVHAKQLHTDVQQILQHASQELQSRLSQPPITTPSIVQPSHVPPPLTQPQAPVINDSSTTDSNTSAQSHELRMTMRVKRITGTEPLLYLLLDVNTGDSDDSMIIDSNTSNIDNQPINNIRLKKVGDKLYEVAEH